MGMSRHHSQQMITTLKRNVLRIPDGVTVRPCIHRCEERQVFFINPLDENHFAWSAWSKYRHSWTSTHSNPLEWMSTQASLLTYTHPNQALSHNMITALEGVVSKSWWSSFPLFLFLDWYRDYCNSKPYFLPQTKQIHITIYLCLLQECYGVLSVPLCISETLLDATLNSQSSFCSK